MRKGWWMVLCLVAVARSEEIREVDGVRYQITSASPSQVRIVWKDDRGLPLRTFPEAKRWLEGQGWKVKTLCNGGIFEPGGIPSGLIIQDNRELRALNLADGHGNFFLKPNGIFLVGNQGASVMPAEAWGKQTWKPDFAVQSGPLLLHEGKIHSAFRAASVNRLIRNGVGVDAKGNVILAITDFHSPKLPNLHEFAMLFKSLGCKEALFLDGVISQMRNGPQIDRESNRFGSMIAIVENR